MVLKDGTQEDYKGAAIRHYRDAESLHESRRLDNAGHLIGIAAECAIKHKFGTLSSRDQSPNLHLPYLLPAARKRLGERSGYRSIFNLLKGDIFREWDVDWRYGPTGKTQEHHIDEWFSITKRLLAAANIKVRLP